MAAADRIANQIQRALIRYWEEFDADVSRLNGLASIQPKDGYSVFEYVDTEGNSANFQLNPIVVNLPERANEVTSDLFVVIKGRLSIDRTHFESDGKVRTLNFATQAAYFRVKGNVLNHVYGAHYDYAENLAGHPVFHGQMRSFIEFSEVIKSQYGLEDAAVHDVVSGILKTVRLPSAQMDVFSFLLQVVADHLLSANSSDDDKARFRELPSTGVRSSRGWAPKWSGYRYLPQTFAIAQFIGIPLTHNRSGISSFWQLENYLNRPRVHKDLQEPEAWGFWRMPEPSGSRCLRQRQVARRSSSRR